MPHESRRLWSWLIFDVRQKEKSVMFAGHIGAAMMLSKAERRLNLGVLVFAALILDVLLWAFVLLGWERVEVPSDYTTRHQLEFVFPYSHGLAASLGWSLLCGTAALIAMFCLKQTRGRAPLVIGFSVFSHWLLDALVHRPSIPIIGKTSGKIGLSLWDHLPLALVIESIVALLGMGLYLHGTSLPRWSIIAVCTLTLLLVAMTIAGMTVAPPPPGSTHVASSSLISIAVVVGLFSWFDSVRPK